jgi:hypothetical protein
VFIEEVDEETKKERERTEGQIGRPSRSESGMVSTAATSRSSEVVLLRAAEADLDSSAPAAPLCKSPWLPLRLPLPLLREYMDSAEPVREGRLEAEFEYNLGESVGSAESAVDADEDEAAERLA